MLAFHRIEGCGGRLGSPAIRLASQRVKYPVANGRWGHIYCRGSSMQSTPLVMGKMLVQFQPEAPLS